ncbi:uncharacterized protein CLUP02_06348 [Colletotrichum lupini]|uniref:Uncharacterized protein n=1 Tax=Colletotrichum lupini TaxID=145971 RepID=A0A9Q8SP44_9PEZI|nr:uncharacterized protein CLUP02_06348 [Colletotrichum lupini]UQC80863.1 hypothetical protein CLUP02_06348 [Colletotrichum lupini]
MRPRERRERVRRLAPLLCRNMPTRSGRAGSRPLAPQSLSFVGLFSSLDGFTATLDFDPEQDARSCRSNASLRDTFCVLVDT